MITEIEVADAVTTEINANTWSTVFTATRVYFPQMDLHKANEIEVVVVPRGRFIEPATRRHNAYSFEIEIVVRKVVADPETEFDPLIKLGDDIATHFQFNRLPTLQSAVWEHTVAEHNFVPDHLERFNQYTGMIKLFFKVVQ